jgi:pyruvate formate lyase activating enzyme
VDLKAFTENFYGKITLTHLKPVLDTLKRLKQDTNVWFEITNLMIPTLNDDASEVKQLASWILENVGDMVPVHFTAFHPDFKLRHIHNTPAETLERSREIALNEGLKFVYVGNVFSNSANTNCPSCNRLLIERDWHQILKYKISPDGHCACGTKIPGHFDYKNVTSNRSSNGRIFHPRMSWN